MRYFSFFLFFTVFFGVYLAGNYYIYIRGLQALPAGYWLKIFYPYIFAFLTLSFIVSRFTGYTSLYSINHVLTWIGSFWLAAAVYFLFSIVIIDLIKLLNVLFHFLPVSNSMEYGKLKLYAFSFIIIVVIFLLTGGYINAIHPRLKVLNIDVAKISSEKKLLKLAVVSDIHLGTLVGKNRLKGLVRIVNAQNPDIILLAGDILDEVQEPILREDIGHNLKSFNARLGVFAIPGNHEYIGGYVKAEKYINSLCIQLLRDSMVEINNQFVLIGRDDATSFRFSGRKRKPLKELAAGIDLSKPIILMDHQPFKLQDAVDCNIDLQISGHTHDGQFWPFNYITNAVYELSCGYKKKGNTHFYVSSGFGTWGPPIRIGTKPEIVIINLYLK